MFNDTPNENLMRNLYFCKRSLNFPINILMRYTILLFLKKWNESEIPRIWKSFRGEADNDPSESCDLALARNGSGRFIFRSVAGGRPLRSVRPGDHRPQPHPPRPVPHFGVSVPRHVAPLPPCGRTD